MHTLNIALFVLAASALILGLMSKKLKHLGFPDSVTLLGLGIALGPQGFDVLDPKDWNDPMLILESVARLALAIGLMGVALRLPKFYVIRHWRSLLVVLTLGMLFMWLMSSLLMMGIIGASLGVALLLGAIITPTDPVVASAIVTGPVAKEALPMHLRDILSAESGANDGLAFLLVLGTIFRLTLPPDESMNLYLAGALVLEVINGVLLGLVIGYLAGYALRKSEQYGWIEHPSVLMFTTALALATLTGVNLLGSNGILAVFVAGLAFDQQVNVSERHQEEYVVEGFDRFFTSPVFVLLGLMIPWQDWLLLGWKAPMLISAVLILRRLPLLLLLNQRTEALRGRIDGPYAGWFGPIGVAALYYVAVAQREVPGLALWPVVSLLVVASILVHGLTATPFSRLYQRLSQRERKGQEKSV